MQTLGSMYFCISKIIKNEKNILLEMCTNACVSFGYGSDFYGVNLTYKSFLKSCGKLSATFFI
jgi:hypothetical protein